MRNSKYELAAWTDGGKVRMVPSLVREFAQPLVERINMLAETRVRNVFDEPGHILALSRAHEALARYLEALGYRISAFREWVAAAHVCRCCDDFWWADCDEGFILMKPFAGRFFAMYAECRRLLRENPDLRHCRCYERLMADFNVITMVLDIWDEQAREIMEEQKAWRFGRSS